MTEGKGTTSGGLPAFEAVARCGVLAAVVAALAFGVLLGVRPVESFDIGYHLAYGERFLDEGDVVDTNGFLYTLRPEARPADRPEPGPTCWYDQHGRYRFPNANWLSQIIMAAVARAWGTTGLSAVSAMLVAGILALVLLVMRRMRVPWLWAAAGLVLVSMVTYTRLNLRPEVFGYLVLLGQLAILAPAITADRPVRLPAAAALVGLQLLLVNLHSFFMFGPVMTGAVLLDRAGRLIRAKVTGLDAEAARALSRRTMLMAAVLACQAGACFVNPWGWRLAVLPVETLVYIRRHSITGTDAGGRHPWSAIIELFGPFSRGGFASVRSTVAYSAVLVLAAFGALAAVLKRRWALPMILAAMAVASLSARRNIGIAGIFLTPLAMGGLWLSAKRWSTGRRAGLTLWAAAVVLVGCGYLAATVVTHKFYYDERLPWRFGVGVSRVGLPIDLAEWLNDRRPEGTLWADFDASSNVHYFTRPHRPVPILTNTWAYPPPLMDTSLECRTNPELFERERKAHNVQIVAVTAKPPTQPLLRALAGNPAWRVVHLDAKYVLLLRADGPNRALAESAAVAPLPPSKAGRPPPEWLAEYEARLRRVDPVAAYSVYCGGITMYHLGWFSEAIVLIAKSLDEDPRNFRAWNMLGICYARRADMRPDVAGKIDDRARARRAFGKALHLEPGYPPAADNLKQLAR